MNEKTDEKTLKRREVEESLTFDRLSNSQSSKDNC